MPSSPNPSPLYPWGRAPCDDCPLARDCRTRLEACAAFELYLKGATEKRWGALPREPQRALYIKLLVRRVDRKRTPEMLALMRKAALLREARKRFNERRLATQ